MPQIIKREDRPSQQKGAAAGSAVVRAKAGAQKSQREIMPIVVAAAGVFTLLLVVFLYHTYVRPPSVKLPTKVAPLPGFSDEYPYNTREWQEAFKQGRTTYLSGVPRPPQGSVSPAAGGSLPR